jgi:nicotinic acid mononucleotide adenylyltransferase
LWQPASATAIRSAAAAGKSLGRFVDPPVSEYIRKMGLYKSPRRAHPRFIHV